MGAKTAMAGRVGTDPFGDRLLEVLDAEGVVHDQVLRVPGASGMSVAIVNADRDYGAVVVSGVNQANTGTDIVLPAETRVLVLQNEVPEPANLAVVSKAGAATRVLLNAAPARRIAAELWTGRGSGRQPAGSGHAHRAGGFPVQSRRGGRTLAGLGPEAVVVTLGGRVGRLGSRRRPVPDAGL